MYTLYMLQYNNYYNRIVKYESDSGTGSSATTALSKYCEFLVTNKSHNQAIFPRINFNVNDYISTTQVINWDGPIGDYIVVTEPGDDGEIIHSRWFIINAQKKLAKQHLLTLHRDILVDKYNVVVGSDAFIERGTPLAIDNSAIYNNEQMTFNQIKQSETSLPDETGCPWIVGYLVPDALKQDINITTFVSTNSTLAQTIQNWELYNYTTLAPTPHSYVIPAPNLRYRLFFETLVPSTSGNTVIRLMLEYDKNFTFLSSSSLQAASTMSTSSTLSKTYSNVASFPKAVKYFIANAFSTSGNTRTFRSEIGHIIGNYLKTKAATLSNYSALPTNVQPTSATVQKKVDDVIGTTIEFAGSALYKMAKYTTNTQSQNYYACASTLQDSLSGLTSLSFTSLGSPDVQIVDRGSSYGGTAYYGDNTIYVSHTSSPSYCIQPNGVSDLSVTFSKDYPVLVDDSYAMFAIPYSDDSNIFANPSHFPKGISALSALNVATELATKLTNLVLVDMQLLPYCPIRDALDANGKIDLDLLPSTRYIEMTQGDEVAQIILWAATSRASFSIPLKEPLLPGGTILEKKIINETQLYRLTSPLYDSSFDFNPAKNGVNGVQSFDVDIRYKPYQPYIHIAPHFGGLYGQDFDDVRGLTCSGDFSLPMTSSAWEQYQIQNKNYQLMFNRQIQNMEVNNKWEMAQTVTNAVVTSLQMAAQGAQMGHDIADINVMGSGAAGAGAAIGAAAGFAVGAAAGAVDIASTAALQKESISYATDTFNMQMENIQALPNTLTKLSAFDNNIRYFPFIEFYTCTEDEVEMLKKKIKLRGMAIQRIGSLGEYQNPDSPYIRGYLIRVGDVQILNQEVLAINNELEKGVYLYGDAYSSINS